MLLFKLKRPVNFVAILLQPNYQLNFCFNQKEAIATIKSIVQLKKPLFRKPSGASKADQEPRCRR